MMTPTMAAMIPSAPIPVVHGLDLISSHMFWNLLVKYVCKLLQLCTDFMKKVSIRIRYVAEMA